MRAVSMPAPLDNPTTRAKAGLGERLFNDEALSGSGRVSCASCHDPERAFAGTRRRSVGINGRLTHRNTPSLLDVGLFPNLTWDGGISGLEEQARNPLVGHGEMGASLVRIAGRLSGDASYASAFERAFGDRRIDADRIVKALASYQRTLRSPVTRFDERYDIGLSSVANSELGPGWRVFERHCLRCHEYSAGNRLFTDFGYRHTGVESADLGRFYVTQDPADRRRFRTPSLRNVSRTAPYMHDGSIDTLSEVIDHYRRRSRQAGVPDLNTAIVTISAQDERHLLAFLNAI